MEHKSVNEFSIRFLEIGGFVGAFEALHLPFGKDCASEARAYHHLYSDNCLSYGGNILPSEGDMTLIKKLRHGGDEHAKVLRGITVWVEINAPRYFHTELDTYRIGAERLGSESTMHIQGKGMSEDELIEMKENLTEGFMQRRVWMFSYQTLGRIYYQRHNHRLPQWRTFCEWIKTLPYAQELIFGEYQKEETKE